MIAQTPLQFQEGFIGPPVPRDQTGAGCPEWQNLRLAPGKSALMPLPGFARSYPHNLIYANPILNTTTGAYGWAAKVGELPEGWPDAVDDRFHATATGAAPAGWTTIADYWIVVTLPAIAMNRRSGRVIAIVDITARWIAAIAFHPGGPELDLNDQADRLPIIQKHLQKVSPYDFPKLIPYKELTWIIAPYDAPMVYDGITVRLAGIYPPHRPPTPIMAGANETAITTATDATDWEPGPTRSDDLAVTADTDNYLLVTIPIADRNASPQTNPAINSGITLAQAELSTPVAIPAARTDCACLRAYIEYDPQNRDHSLPERTIAISLSPNTILEPPGDILVEPALITHIIQERLHPGEARTIQIPWSQDASYTVKAVGIHLLRSVPETHFTEDFVNLRVKLYWIADATINAETLLPAGDYRFAFSWAHAATQRESNLSPVTDLTTLAAGGPVTLDISGKTYPAQPVYDTNQHEQAEIDRVRIYIHRAEYGTDTLGFPAMYLYGEYPIPNADGDDRRIIALNTDKSEDVWLAAPGPQYNAAPPPATRAACPDGERMILANQPGYSIGRGYIHKNTPNQMRRLRRYTSGTDECWATSNPSTLDFTDANANFWTATDNGEDVLAYATADPSGATWTEDETQRATYGRWMRNREISINDQGTFLIEHTVPEDTGFATWMRFSRASTTGETAYYPADQFAAADYVLAEYQVLPRPNRVVFTSVLSTGTLNEGTAMANYRDLEMPGDEILSLQTAGEFLIAIGRRGHLYLRQNRAAIDDLGADPYPNPRWADGGTVGTRTVARLGNDTLLLLTPEGRLATIGSGGGLQILPVSERFTGWIGSHYRVQDAYLQYALLCYDPVHRYAWLILPDSNIGPAGADTTDKYADYPPAGKPWWI